MAWKDRLRSKDVVIGETYVYRCPIGIKYEPGVPWVDRETVHEPRCGEKVRVVARAYEPEVPKSFEPLFEVEYVSDGVAHGRVFAIYLEPVTTERPATVAPVTPSYSERQQEQPAT